MDGLARTEETLFAQAELSAETVQNRNYVQLADTVGLEQFEKILGLPVEPEAADTYRRQRILNRMAMQPPFTLQFLAERLDALLGQGRWRMEMDYNHYCLTVKYLERDNSIFPELEQTILLIKPANIQLLLKLLTELQAETGVRSGVRMLMKKQIQILVTRYERRI